MEKAVAKPEYRIVHNEPAGQWEVKLKNGEIIGYLSYEYLDDSIIFTHTSLRQEYRGQGIARDLVQQVLAYEEELGEHTIVPACSYVKKVYGGSVAASAE